MCVCVCIYILPNMTNAEMIGNSTNSWKVMEAFLTRSYGSFLTESYGHKNIPLYTQPEYLAYLNLIYSLVDDPQFN